jgi:hypothetical protein
MPAPRYRAGAAQEHDEAVELIVASISEGKLDGLTGVLLSVVQRINRSPA